MYTRAMGIVEHFLVVVSRVSSTRILLFLCRALLDCFLYGKKVPVLDRFSAVLSCVALTTCPRAPPVVRIGMQRSCLPIMNTLEMQLVPRKPPSELYQITPAQTARGFFV